MAKETTKKGGVTDSDIDEIRKPNEEILAAAAETISKQDFERKKAEAVTQLLISDYVQMKQLIVLRRTRANEQADKAHLEAVTALNEEFKNAKMATDLHKTKLRTLETEHQKTKNRIEETFQEELRKIRETNREGYRGSSDY